jgi:hypothetical protein
VCVAVAPAPRQAAGLAVAVAPDLLDERKLERELGVIASGVVRSLLPLPGHVFIEDLWQTAFAAGLEDWRDAADGGRRPSREWTAARMRRACVNELRERERWERVEQPIDDFVCA